MIAPSHEGLSGDGKNIFREGVMRYYISSEHDIL